MKSLNLPEKEEYNLASSRNGHSKNEEQLFKLTRNLAIKKWFYTESAPTVWHYKIQRKDR